MDLWQYIRSCKIVKSIIEFFTAAFTLIYIYLGFYLLILLLAAPVVLIPRTIEGLTSAEKLAAEYYTSSAVKVRVGAICLDGWISYSTGSGTCSHHGGVREWRHKYIYTKTYEDCLKKAYKRSWID
jgi:hypothetical protein